MGQGILDGADSRVGIKKFKARYQHGRLVELDDSSMWKIPPGHEVFVEEWTGESDITVVPGDYTGYPYDLINVRSGHKVPARCTEQNLWPRQSD